MPTQKEINAKNRSLIMNRIEKVNIICTNSKCKEDIKYIRHEIETKPNSSSKQISIVDKRILKLLESIHSCVVQGNYPLARVLCILTKVKVVERNSKDYDDSFDESQFEVKNDSKGWFAGLNKNKKKKDLENNIGILKDKLDEITAKIDESSNVTFTLENYGKEIEEVYQENKDDIAIENHYKDVIDEYNLAKAQATNAAVAVEKLRNKIKYKCLTDNLKQLLDLLGDDKDSQDEKNMYEAMLDDLNRGKTAETTASSIGMVDGIVQTSALTTTETVTQPIKTTIVAPWENKQPGQVSSKNDIKNLWDQIEKTNLDIDNIQVEIDDLKPDLKDLLIKRRMNPNNDISLNTKIQILWTKIKGLVRDQQSYAQIVSQYLDVVFVKGEEAIQYKTSEIQKIVEGIPELAVKLAKARKQNNEDLDQLNRAVDLLEMHQIDMAAKAGSPINTEKDNDEFAQAERFVGIRKDSVKL